MIAIVLNNIMVLKYGVVISKWRSQHIHDKSQIQFS